MRIQFCGADRTVTGSCHLVESQGVRVLLDCGMYQGPRDEANDFNQWVPTDVNRIDAIILSHGHLDHCGKLPVLTLDPLLEHALLEALRPGEAGSFLALDPEVAERLLAEVSASATAAEQQGRQPVLVCAAPIRPALRRLVRNVQPGLAVLSYLEIGRQLELESMGVVSLVPATV